MTPFTKKKNRKRKKKWELPGVNTKSQVWKSNNWICFTSVNLYWWICRYNSLCLDSNTIEQSFDSISLEKSSIHVLHWCSLDSNTRCLPLGLESGLKDLWNEIVMNLWLCNCWRFLVLCFFWVLLGFFEFYWSLKICGWSSSRL